MLALGSKCRCWVVDAGVGSQTLALDSRHHGWLYTLALGSTCWCRFVGAGVGSCWVGVARCFCRYGVCEAGPAGKRVGVEDGGRLGNR